MMDDRKKFSALVQNYFCKFLINQRHVSDRTVQTYRDTFRLLFKFISEKTGKTASQLCLSDTNADMILNFLNYLESERKNVINSRNIRLAAIRSFFHYVEYQEPEALPAIQRIFAIPMKRFDRVLIESLSKEEISAIINGADATTWSGRRDQALMTLMYNTGGRVSEMINLKREDLELSKSHVVHLHGKGRKERSIPLWKSTSHVIDKWLKEIDEKAETPLFPNRFGERMTRAGIEERLNFSVNKAKIKCHSLKNKKVSPHVIRHTTAMHLLQSGVDLTVISLWLGHENINTTHKYMEANLQMKERILEAVEEPKHGLRHKPISDNLLKFLESL